MKITLKPCQPEAYQYFARFHYDTETFQKSAKCLMAFIGNKQVGFCASITRRGKWGSDPRPALFGHKVIAALPTSHPAYFSLWAAIADAQAEYLTSKGYRFFSQAPADHAAYRDNSPLWKSGSKNGSKEGYRSYQYVGATPGRPLKTAKAYEHVSSFLDKQEADDLYSTLMEQQWIDNEDGSSEINYGYTYSRGEPAIGEIPDTPDFLQKLADRVSLYTKHPVNYVQVHRFGPEHSVRPHVDPPMVVPMLTLGQERVFRYGGTMHCAKCATNRMPICPHLFSIKHQNRPLEAHQPEQETLMRHGDLLMFYGSGVIHSMYPASKDERFNRNGYDYRISILFRYTTEAMRKYGVGTCNQYGHRKQYRAAVEEFRATLPAPDFTPTLVEPPALLPVEPMEINLSDLWVLPCTSMRDVREFVEKHHYSHSIKGVTPFLSFEVVLKEDHQKQVGAAIFGVGAMTQTKKKFGEYTGTERPAVRAVELRRFVLLDELPRNSESFVLGNMLKKLATLGVDRIYSYADPNQLRAEHCDGKHTGVIYSACGFTPVQGGGKTKAIIMQKDFKEWKKGRRLPVRNLDQYQTFKVKSEGDLDPGVLVEWKTAAAKGGAVVWKEKAGRLVYVIKTPERLTLLSKNLRLLWPVGRLLMSQKTKRFCT